MAFILNKKWPSPFTTPLLIGTVVVSAVLSLCNISYSAYNDSAKYLSYFLVPVTVCFAVPMYKQLPLLKRHALPILLAVFIGCVSSIMAICILCIFFGLGDIIAKSLGAISTTTAIAIGITEKLGGTVALTVSAVIITGVLGASVSDWVCRIMGLKDPIARGLAVGNASHAAGTVKAMEMGQVEGAMSSLAIVLSGLITAIMTPIIIYMFF
ncbi:MAG: LrgB family protein [Rickettsiales bacterium]|nr:LrgB family protein [Rickettsiales bacterium]